MIRKLKYHEIDFVKYTHCLETSEQRNWYAKKEVLDELCESWEVLVYDDYKAVMPIPLKKKLGFSFAAMPLFCQQLGVFSKGDNAEINSRFLKYLKKNYKIFQYSFNHHNQLPTGFDKKKNYIIPVTSYHQLRKKYFKGRKSTVKSAQHLIYREVNFDSNIISFIELNSKGLAKSTDLLKFKKYLHILDQMNVLKLCGAFKDDRLINLAVLISDHKELFLLALVNDDNFKNENGASFLIDQILQNCIEDFSFNFMGSNIRNIEVFFKSFGGQLCEFSSIENKKIMKLLKLVKP
ncbi:hypothetical protein [Chryseobacterium sp. CT-SW4]|uniref:hypothetical protein n=1 Tax=Chryseobacterium sp. SW-1 TaxID=3157343 RepID=UPI003B0153CD